MADPSKPPRRTARWIALILAILLALTLWDGSLRTPTGPASGPGKGHATTAPTSQPRDLRVATFNIHSGIGADGQFNLDRTAASLRDFDLIGLNEVRGDLLGDEDQARLLGRKLDMDWLFAPTEHRWWHDDFGNALLSRIPIAHWQRVPLPCTQSRGFRNYLLLKVPHAGQLITVLITHLDRQRDHAPHVQLITELFLSLPAPAILMGDLNTDASDPLLHNLLTAPGVIDAVGQHLPSTPSRIDWILLRGLTSPHAGLIQTGASDHPAAWAQVTLPD